MFTTVSKAMQAQMKFTYTQPKHRYSKKNYQVQYKNLKM